MRSKAFYVLPKGYTRTPLYRAYGETHTVAEWARKKGFKPHTIRNRLRKGWGVKRALETPTRGNG